MNKPEKSYFENLDALRFTLACMVLGGHSMLGDTLISIFPFDWSKKAITLMTNGGVAVSFFFVLSGFLITHLLLKEKTSTGTIGVGHFYMRRVLRIWPLYFSVLLFSFFIYPLIKSQLGYTNQNPFRLLYQVLLLANFDNINVQHLGLTGVAPMMVSINWSVSIEEQFYLCWPILFFLVKSERLWAVCLLIVVGSWIFRLTNTDHATQYYHTLSVISDLSIGGLGAWLTVYSRPFLGFITTLSKYLILTLYLTGIIVLMYVDEIFSLWFNLTTLRVFSATFFCFIIVEQCYASDSFFKFGNFKSLSSMGKYTFGIYMLHPIGIQAAILIFRVTGWTREDKFFWGLLYSVIGFVTAFLLAIASYHLLEKYFLDKRKLFN